MVYQFNFKRLYGYTMPDSNNKRDAIELACEEFFEKAEEFFGKSERRAADYKDFFLAAEEMTKSFSFAADVEQLAAHTGNSVGMMNLLMMCGRIVESGHKLPCDIREYLMEHARLTPADRRQLMPFDLN